MKTIRLGLVLLLFATCARSLAAEDLKIAAYLGTDGSYSADSVAKGDRRTVIFVTMTNSSDHPLLVLTSLGRPWFSPEPSQAENEVHGAVSCRIGPEQFVLDFVRIPSLSELMPVLLRPGESSGTEIAVSFPSGVRLTNIRLVYEVERSIGERYNAWYGKVETRLVRQSITGTNTIRGR